MEQQQLNISLDKTTEIKCKSCNNNVFTEGTLLRKVSKFLVGSAQDGIIPIQIMVCIKCNEVLDETIPIQLKNEYAEVVEEPVNEEPERGKIIQLKQNV
jgi:hypothetical protein